MLFLGYGYQTVQKLVNLQKKWRNEDAGNEFYVWTFRFHPIIWHM
jgi:hypothetical protein